MRKKCCKKAAILFLVAVFLVCSMSACGKNENTYTDSTEIGGSQSYSSEEKDKDTDTEEDTAAQEEDSEETEYILPDSDTQKLTESDLKELSKEELRLARNEIYARLGRKFDDEALRDYFESKSWYEGTIEPSDFSEELLNEIEKYNVTFIAGYEDDQENQQNQGNDTGAVQADASENPDFSDKSYENSGNKNSGNKNSNYTICSQCKGLGHCPYCSGGFCTYCNGTGKMTCTSCVGLGYCLACGGNGYSYSGVGIAFNKHTCTTCRGSGKCSLCKGSRYTRCSTCGGSGKCKYCYGQYSCSRCFGRGYY